MRLVSKLCDTHNNGAIFFENMSESAQQRLLWHHGVSTPEEANLIGVPIAYLHDPTLFEDQYRVDMEVLCQQGLYRLAV